VREDVVNDDVTDGFAVKNAVAVEELFGTRRRIQQQ
jgi:hypothetical protein